MINDRYELRRSPIARGGMGEVWEGRDTKLDREVAVKFVRFPDGVPDDELIRRFVRESRITARLQHPGVPAVFDVGTEGGRPFLVMQRIRGISISDLLAQHERLPIGWAAAIAAQTCSVLAVAHHASLIHRDLKPANLMLEADGTVKVLDFGLAGALDVADMSQITRSGQNIGTPAYMAPEQVIAAMSSPRTDLYALGCTLHEMLTGRQLFTGATPYSVMSKQVDETPTSVRDVRLDVPTDLDALILALLEKKPGDRPDSALATYERLLPFATDLGMLPGILHPPSIPSPVRMYAEVVSRAYQDTAERATGKQIAEREVARQGVDAPAAPAVEPAQTAEAGVTRQRIETARTQAANLVRQARYSEAADLLGSTVRAAGAVFGPVDAEVVELRMDWAHVLFEGGDYRAAAPAYQALKADLIERDGPDTDLVFRCRLQYATCHALLGATSVALVEMQSLAADERRVFGPDNPRLVELRRQIGLLQLGAGQREEAESTLRELRDDLVRTHGPRHAVVPKIEELLGSLPDGEQ
ncbi:serine/threonine-protein kinase [Prauserella flavalba]|uniref:serine/threonine-protein kinase n=1 Tax=Prauserella flavalba TaxID=1477506 RepID=UPI0036EFBDD8